MTRLLLLFCTFYSLWPSTVLATRPLPTTTQAPDLDGILDEPLWQSAFVCTDFKTIEPDYGLPPSEFTELYLIYDDEYLYVAFNCRDRQPQQIKASVSGRDQSTGGDWVAFCLDAFNDEGSAYFFATNPFGNQSDGMLDSNAEPDARQDWLWKSSGKLNDGGYVVEMAIPFRSLRFPAGDTLTMGFKAARFISRRSEEVDFPEYRPDGGAALAQFQKISLSGIRSGRTLEILPAVTWNKDIGLNEGRAESLPGKTEFSLTTKIGISSGLTLDATYNPDFSQVETDAGQVDINLRNALRYPEKRPFFLEGQELYGLGGHISDSPLEALVNTRNIVDPLVGLKLSGRIGKDNILSALYALDEYPGNVIDSLNGRMIHHSFIRFGRRLRDDNYLGGIYSYQQFNGRSVMLGGGDGQIRLNASSQLGFHAIASRDRSSGQLANGNALGIAYGYSTRKFEFTTGLYNVSEHFHPGLGYLNRRGITNIILSPEYSFYPNSTWLRRITPYYWSRHGYDHPSRLWETFNVFGVHFALPRQSYLNLSTWLANETFSGQQFSRNALRIRFGTEPSNLLAIGGSWLAGKMIYYDPEAPYQGVGHNLELQLTLRPGNNFNFTTTLVQSSLKRPGAQEWVYQYTIWRNRMVYQFNDKLFLRNILEYNVFYQKLAWNVLLSFTYVPGTVVHIGYGSGFERIDWNDQTGSYFPADDFMRTEQHFFFKASYLWRK